MMKLGTVGVLALILTSCSDTTPTSVQLSPTTAVLVGPEEIPLQAVVKNKAGEPLQVETALTVQPGDVAVITQNKGLRCTKRGDANVTASAGQLSATGVFRCRPVARIDVPRDLRLIIPNGPAKIQPVALDEGGHAYQDVKPRLAIQNAAIATIGDDGITPRAVGSTMVFATAGTASAATALTVIRKIKSEPLLLNDGARIAVTLQQGHYEVEIKGRSNKGGRQGVTLKWIGGDPDCADHPEAQEIASTCAISNTGSLVIENPTTFGLGPAFDGFVNIYQVP